MPAVRVRQARTGTWRCAFVGTPVMSVAPSLPQNRPWIHSIDNDGTLLSCRPIMSAQKPPFSLVQLWKSRIAELMAAVAPPQDLASSRARQKKQLTGQDKRLLGIVTKKIYRREVSSLPV